jgi:ferric iron reductase protein FhuF
VFLGLDRSAAAALQNATGGLLGDRPLRKTFMPPARSVSDEQLLDEPLIKDPQLASIIAELRETVKTLQEQLAESARQNGTSQSSTVVAGAMLIGLVLLLALSAAVHEGAPEVHGKINEIVELPSNIYSYLMCIAMGVVALGIRRR